MSSANIAHRQPTGLLPVSPLSSLASQLPLAEIPASVADDPSWDLRLRVYVELQRRGAGTGYVHVPQAELAEQFQRSDRTIRRLLQALVAAGYLKSRPYYPPHGGRSAEYHAVLRERIA